MGMNSNAQILVPSGNGLSALDPQQLESMPISQFQRDVKGNIVNAQSAFFYDSTYIKKSVAIVAGAKKSLFTQGKNQSGDTQFGTTTSIGTGDKSTFLTNMQQNGDFPSGTTFIMEGAGVQCVTPADVPATVAANGAITGPDYTASVAVSGANNLIAALNNLEILYKRGDETKKRGLAMFWPAPPGVGINGSAGSPNGGYYQNGAGGLVQFSHPVVLGFGDNFSFDVVNVCGSTWTPTHEMMLRIVIWGTAIYTATPF